MYFIIQHSSLKGFINVSVDFSIIFCFQISQVEGVKFHRNYTPYGRISHTIPKYGFSRNFSTRNFTPIPH